jgi:phage terminase large subunit
VHYLTVPRDLVENVKYRIRLREQCAADARCRGAVWRACKEDVLFFMTAMCWLYEPRPRFGSDGRALPKRIPFIPWEHQVQIIKKIDANLGVNDIAVYKSRGEGLSWIGVLLALHDWLFDDMAKIGLVSSSMLKADDPGNMDSLMAKMVWELDQLPPWMIGKKGVDWKRNIAEHYLINFRNASQANAFAATADAGRSGRYKWFLADELAFWDSGDDRKFMESIRGSTDCRLAISTPNGSEGEFYEMVYVPSNAAKIRVHWTQNQSKNLGLYKLLSGVPVAVDARSNPLMPDYVGPKQSVTDLFA